MVPRIDCIKGLKINTTDSIYHTAVTEANESGVQLKAYSLDYALDGTIHKNCEIDVII